MKKHLQPIGNQHVRERTKRDTSLIGCSFLASFIIYITRNNYYIKYIYKHKSPLVIVDNHLTSLTFFC